MLVCVCREAKFKKRTRDMDNQFSSGEAFFNNIHTTLNSIENREYTAQHAHTRTHKLFRLMLKLKSDMLRSIPDMFQLKTRKKRSGD